MNSVKEILDECNQLVSIAENIEDRLDVYNSLCELNKEMRKLSEVYAKEPYDENLVRIQKESLNYAAINLEYILSTVDLSLRKRYINRVTLSKLEAACRKVILTETNVTKVYQVAVEELARVRELTEQSKSISFALQECDVEFLNKLSRKYEL